MPVKATVNLTITFNLATPEAYEWVDDPVITTWEEAAQYDLEGLHVCVGNADTEVTIVDITIDGTDGKNQSAFKRTDLNDGGTPATRYVKVPTAIDE